MEEFEKNALQNGIKIHWAKDANEHNKIVEKILKEKKAKKIVKSKSMLTEECELNPYLEKRGYEIIDTDLGERIVQIAKQKPSHIVLPAIHLKKEEVAKIFKEDDFNPEYLTSIARKRLREHFESADVAITGVNFAVSSEGAINLQQQLLGYRSLYKEQIKEKKDIYYKVAFFILKSPLVYRLVMKFTKFIPYYFYKKAWSAKRESPKLAKKSFKDIYESL